MHSSFFHRQLVLVVCLTCIPRANADSPPSFRYDVLPTLTKAGCNAGTCHGTPTGKNGFRLSLRGFDPQQDLVVLTREAAGRRINLLQPGESLILKKATAQVPHLGGQRIRIDDEAYQLLYDWIAAGAPDDPIDHRQLVELRIDPTSAVVDAPEDQQTFRVTATFSDAREEDVTGRCRFSMADSTTADLQPGGTVRRRSRGEVSLAAEFAGMLVSATVLFREPLPQFDWPDPPTSNEIDELVFSRLRHLQIEPAGLCDDATFLRRACLDANGRLPTPEKVRAFLVDNRTDKRERLVSALLESPEFAEWWAMKWTDRLGCNERFVGKWGAIKFHSWISTAMAQNVPHDKFVRSILTASGPNYSNPPAGFWRRMRVGGIGNMDPLLAAEEISQLFMGVRIQCARCHNHPGESWTQDDYYGLAAFFPRLGFKDGPYVKHQYDKEVAVFPVDTGDVTHPRTGAGVVPTTLDGETSMVDSVLDRRVPFADWLTAPDNPFFARAEVNRIWYHLLGRGIVDPVDDFRTSNPPSHPELLEWLTEQFIASGFDRKHVIRQIMNSNVYQLDFQRTETGTHEAQYFSYYRPRRLQAEQLLDAIGAATGVPESFPGFPPETRAIHLPDGEFKHPFLEAFGRPARALACECERESSTNMSQALQIVGGAGIHRKLTSDSGRCAQLASADMPTTELLDELYLATLSRYPTDEERSLLSPRLEASEFDRRQVIEDLMWSLLNHREFLFQH
jgi:hypothetical protein